ncbi:MAG: DUF4224 domain-containing protein [Gammaproteobacteria bacterium]|nr:DUF4224 domain-containing protein [Gammaproteobacteria bacterium]
MIRTKPAQKADAQQYYPVILGSHFKGITPRVYDFIPPLQSMLQSAEEFTNLLNIFFCSNNLLSANVLPSAQTKAGKYTLSICLTKEDIRELTLKAHYTAQARTLSEMGIRYALRPDGSPVVLHSTLKDMETNPKQKSNQPDFSSLGQ